MRGSAGARGGREGQGWWRERGSALLEVSATEAIQGHRHLEPAGAGVVADKLVGGQRIQPLLVEAVGEAVEEGVEGGGVVHERVAQAQDRVPDRPCLALVDDLVHAREVDVAVSEPDLAHPSDAHLLLPGPVPVPHRLDALAQRHALPHLAEGEGGGVGSGERLGLGRDVTCPVVFLHDDEVSDVEVVAAAADDQDRRDPELRVDRLHLVDERHDGLLVRRYELNHALIAHHEVCRRRVLVDQQHLGANFEAFDDVGCL
mmetsp:Transcript_1054/g.2468  ORF Transcript_1054/g.2468 Transcript_1054/m.2468 type:complete len:259 (+) Transcript_1054:211-987(+)